MIGLSGRRTGFGVVAIIGAMTAAVVSFAPSDAGTHPRSDPRITVTAGGDRTGSTSVGGLDGVRFHFYAGRRGTPPAPGSTPVASCVTGNEGVTGRCSVDVPSRAGGSGASEEGYWVVQADVPDGWFASPTLDTGAAGSIAATDYAKLFIGGGTTNISLPGPLAHQPQTAPPPRNAPA